MINYYYEIRDDVTTFGQQIKYLCLTDIKPPIQPWMQLHEEALKNSNRVWLENANGVCLVKGPHTDLSWGKVDEKEFVWLKLICKDIETL